MPSLSLDVTSCSLSAAVVDALAPGYGSRTVHVLRLLRLVICSLVVDQSW